MKYNSVNLQQLGFRTDFNDKFSDSPNLSIIRHPNLDQNPIFCFLKQDLQKFYNDRKKPSEKQTMHKRHSHDWKERFYTSLQNLLAELSFTEDPSTQQKMLERIRK